MATEYKYTITGDFAAATQIDEVQFAADINANATVSIDVDHIDHTDDDVSIWMASALSAPQKTELDAMVAAYVYVVPLVTHGAAYEVIVDVNGEGDYTSVAAAFNAGATIVFVKKGVYVETSNVVIPEGGQLVGEASSKVILYFVGPYGVVADGSGGTQETGGTVAISTDSKSVTGTGTSFTNASPGQYILFGTNYYVISSIESDTALTIDKTYRGTALSGEPTSIQSMHTGVKVNNLAITNASGLGTGLHLRAVRHSGIQGIAVDGCNKNILVEDSGDMNLLEVISVNSVTLGISVMSCMSMSFSVLNVFNCISHGIHLGGSCSNIIMESSATENNGEYGISVADTANQISLTDMVIRFNDGGGIDIKSTTDGISASSCTISNNTGFGINTLGDNTVISGCFIDNNTTIGVLVGLSSILEGNHIVNNGTDGISVPLGKDKCIIDGNKIRNNGGVGIDIIGSETTLEGNVVDSNTGNGINIAGDNNVLADTICTGNGGKGVYITGDDNIFGTNRVKGSTGNGCEVASGATDNVLTNNIIKGNTGTNAVDAGTNTIMQCVKRGTVDPGVSDDISGGCGVGSIWINTTRKASFVSVDSSVGAAVWKENTNESRTYAPSATNPTSPTPAAGDRYYNTALNQDMVYDGTRSKWLSACTLTQSAGAGTSGPAAGSFYRGVNGATMSAVKGIHVPKGTVTRIEYAAESASTHTVEVLVDGVQIASLASGGAATASSGTVDADFDEGILSFRNSSSSSGAVDNILLSVHYKMRV